MIYSYECPYCDNKFDVIKHHSKHREIENCACGEEAVKLFCKPMLAKVEPHEFNHGLGCVTKGRKHREQICKDRGLVEVGNESMSKVSEELRESRKRRASWDGI